MSADIVNENNRAPDVLERPVEYWAGTKIPRSTQLPEFELTIRFACASDDRAAKIGILIYEAMLKAKFEMDSVCIVNNYSVSKK